MHYCMIFFKEISFLLFHALRNLFKKETTLERPSDTCTIASIIIKKIHKGG